MKLKSFGCSFIWGCELPGEKFNTRLTIPSRFAWPALIAQHKKMEYQCLAYPGSGNTRIAEQVLNEIQSGEPALYVIGWTFINRFDYVQSHTKDNWNTLTAWSDNSIGKFYYRNIHSQYVDKLNALMTISLTLQHLQASGNRFLMTYMDELIFEQEFHHSPGMQLMQDQIRPYLHSFDGDNFVDWSVKQGYAIGPRGGHPLEAAHSAAADYILNHNLV